MAVVTLEGTLSTQGCQGQPESPGMRPPARGQRVRIHCCLPAPAPLLQLAVLISPSECPTDFPAASQNSDAGRSQSRAWGPMGFLRNRPPIQNHSFPLNNPRNHRNLPTRNRKPPKASRCSTCYAEDTETGEAERNHGLHADRAAGRSGHHRHGGRAAVASAGPR